MTIGPLAVLAAVLIGVAVVGFVIRTLLTLAKIALVVGAVLLALSFFA
ncbi:MAG: hypothetical protein ABFS34_02195 [Gemmatimonadota bacterium]